MSKKARQRHNLKMTINTLLNCENVGVIEVKYLIADVAFMHVKL
jgi:hypothetical protein